MVDRSHVLKSAELRGKRDYAGAIAEIEDNMSSLDEVVLVPGLLQAFYAAVEWKDETKAREIAALLVKHEPALRSIKRYL